MNDKMYHGPMTDGNIRGIFQGAGDFNVRRVDRGAFTLYVYAIDGLTSGGDISEYVIKPIMEQLQGDTMQTLYANALNGAVVNSVAKACKDLDDAAMLLVNGFTVVLFPGVGAIAFETKSFLSFL